MKSNVEWYKYLGIEDSIKPHDYNIFLKSKWKKVRGRIAKCRCVGGHMDGLNSKESRKLYLTQVRPIIEFGATTIPYCDDVLKELERMQAEALRCMFGFFKSTKFETMNALVGVASMRSRVSQLKVCFFNKIKTFNGLYLRSLLCDGNPMPSGLREDIRKIHTEWSTFPEFRDTLGSHRSLNTWNNDFKKFNAMVKSMFERLDCSVCFQKQIWPRAARDRRRR